MIFGFAFQIIFILVLLSGIIAFVGNRTGRFFGKKRLSVFNLRPRYTATIFTIISGILIMVLTFATLFLVSRDVRMALFGLEGLKHSIKAGEKQLAATEIKLNNQKKELSDVKKELEIAREQKNNLEKEKAHLLTLRNLLREEIENQKVRKVVFGAGEIALIRLLRGGVGAGAAKLAINGVLNDLDEEVKKYNIPNVSVDKADFDATVSYLANTTGDIVLRIKSIENVIAGSDLWVRLEVLPNELVYHKGEKLVDATIPEGINQSTIEEELKSLLSTARFTAARRGVLPNVAGSFGSLPYSEIFEAAKKIKGSTISVKVNVLAKEDIYLIGPLLVKLEIVK
ncbi:hypothetical protein A2246_00775 [candidate division WOR-1 bacterium RIFOXYA2_FULL_37_7]|uniref:DUF3084 domain-containing protein n=1 Tax=candidate division WOR-1 bacterium RIFOXYB2_FULL_37_13 TaxID=1802579 RepID=A0A1F4SXB0_UNCSA|nr:MAG: hypothetical protein A2246_00775 [candidate division WOR-1 bacterium RIFOXYA2_FULL_37_7]OGC25054.1 MAG: hypothetical protein A2310_00085 [candidate division WOR-1 bacterium RIFOXYB2_FULL_37_13]